MKLRFPFLLVAALVCILTVQAQTPSQMTIEGVVVAAGAGTPIASAKVRFLQNFVGTLKETTTDANGKFSASGLVPGAYIVFVSARGFADVFSSADAAGGNTPPALRIELKRPGVIAGKVLDQSKQPRSGLEVEAVSIFYDDRGPMMLGAGNAETDDRGEYRISGLQAGDYYVIARDSDSEISRPTLYPGIVDFKTATKISVTNGAEMRAGDFSLLPAEKFMVSLRIVPPSDWPTDSRGGIGLQPVQVVSPARPLPQGWDYAFFGRAADGAFSAAFAPGTYDLYFRLDNNTKPETPEGIQNSAACGHASVTVVDKDIDLGALKIDKGIPIQGHITFRDGRPTDFDSTKLRVVPGSDMRCYMVAKPTPVTAEGTFTIPNMARGELRPRVEGLPEGFFVDSIRYAAREVIDSGMTIATEDGGPVEITVSKNGGTIEGIAKNAKEEPAANAFVLLVPQEERRKELANFRSMNADKGGAFRVTGLRPGEYRVLVWERSTPQWRDPEVLRSFESRGTLITARGGAVSNTGNIRALGN